MATVAQCRAALDTLAAKLATPGRHPARRRPERTLSCRVRDLDVAFAGVLRDGRLSDVREDPGARGQVRISVDSDDLVALAEGRLGFTAAWTGGRLRVDASVTDLLRLRGLL